MELDNGKGDQGDAGPAIADKLCDEGASVIGFENNLPICSDEYTYPPKAKVMFVTAGRYQGGALKGLVGADKICQAETAGSLAPAGTGPTWMVRGHLSLPHRCSGS